MEQGGGDSGGFTIVETMIVLAVSGILAVSALLLINGRQNKTEFQTAINDLQQQFQQIINETTSGYYPNNGSFSCMGNAAPNPNGAGSSTGPKLTKGSPAGQGTNSGCIFLGKVIELGTNAEPGQLVIYPIVGNQNVSSGGTSIQTLQQAAPTAIAPTFTQPDYPDATTAQSLESGLTVSTASTDGFRNVSTSGTVFASSALGILAGDTSGNISSASKGELNSGSQQFSLYLVQGLDEISPPPDPRTVAGTLYYPTSPTASRGLKNITSATLCMNSATTPQSGLFTFGDANNGGLGVTLQIYSKADCAS